QSHENSGRCSTGSLESESFRKKLCNVGLFGSVRTLKIDGGIRAELVDHLTAGAARRARHPVIIRNGDSLYFDLWPQLCYGGKNCSALGAVRHTVGSILDIAADENLSVRKQDC